MTELGELTPEEIEDFLRDQLVGRVGCQARGRPYIIPVTYAYDGRYVYGYASDGLKLRIMRENPLVCFEVDEVEDQTQWRSVIAHGRFEELQDAQAYDALRLLSARLRNVESSFREEFGALPTFVTRRGRYGLAYRIALTEKTGRFERHKVPCTRT